MNHTMESHSDSNFFLKGFMRKTSSNDSPSTHISEEQFRAPNKINSSTDCDKCNRQFTRHSNLIKHQLFTHAIKTHKCEVCPSKFRSEYRLKKHVIDMHTNDKMYDCHICSTKFDSKKSLIVHRKTHVVKKVTQCGNCLKLFLCLKQHERKCNNREKLVSREISQKRSTNNEGLANQIREHTDENISQCEIPLIEHRKVHGDESFQTEKVAAGDDSRNHSESRMQSKCVGDMFPSIICDEVKVDEFQDSMSLPVDFTLENSSAKYVKSECDIKVEQDELQFVKNECDIQVEQNELQFVKSECEIKLEEDDLKIIN